MTAIYNEAILTTTATFDTQLERVTKRQPIMVAGSIRLHEQFGFEVVGVRREVGFKFGRWLDIYLMQTLY